MLVILQTYGDLNQMPLFCLFLKFLPLFRRRILRCLDMCQI